MNSVLTHPDLREAEQRDAERKKRVCFVCTGNTCRSPMAEAVANALIKETGRTDLRTLAKSASPYVVTWSSQPTNVEFVLDARSMADDYRIYSEPDGLRLKRITGFMIIVK